MTEISEMKDAALINAVAIEVMGWKYAENKNWRNSLDPEGWYYRLGLNRIESHVWRPLDYSEHCWAVLDEMWERGWDDSQASNSCYGDADDPYKNEVHKVIFRKVFEDGLIHVVSYHATRKRAILEAALQAKRDELIFCA